MEKLTDKEKFKQNELINNWAEQTANAYGLDLMEVKDDQIISFLAQTQVKNNGVLDAVSVLLPKLKECQDARKDFINKKAQSGYSTLLKGVGDHFQAGVNWALNYISNKR